MNKLTEKKNKKPVKAFRTIHENSVETHYHLTEREYVNKKSSQILTFYSHLFPNPHNNNCTCTQKDNIKNTENYIE